MAKLMVLITTRMNAAHDVGDAWQKLGVTGVTFMEGFGLQRLREARHSVEVLPGTLSMLELLRDQERNSIMALTVLHDDSLVDQLVAAAEKILGSLDEPDNGIVFTLDIDRVFGLRFYE